MRVLVIGAGLLGLASAYYLRKHGLDVCVVDRREGVAREASFANGGMLHASLANPWNEPGILGRAFKMIGREDSALLVRAHAVPRMLRWGVAFIRNSNPARYAKNTEKNAHLAHYSIQVMQGLRDELAFDYDCETRGTLKLYREREELETAQRLCERFAGSGVRYQTVDGPGAVGIEPALRPIENHIFGAIYFPDDESGDAYKFCLGLYEACVAAGVEFRFDATVGRLIQQGDRIAAAEINRRAVRADAFVLAAGSHSPLLSRTVRIRLPIQPVKGYSITLQRNGWEEGPRVPIIDDHLHVAVCPLGDRIRVAGTAEFAGYDRELNKHRIENLFNVVRRVFPAYESYMDVNDADPWTELRPMSCDGVGIMGKSPIGNLYFNTGHGHLGWTMCAGAGRTVADLVAGVTPELDLAPYGVERF